MEDNRANLSAECKQPLIAAGEVPHKYLGNKKTEWQVADGVLRCAGFSLSVECTPY